MAMSKNFSGDTLFFIFEQDFEFHPDPHGEETREALPQEQGSSSTSSWQPSGSSAAGWANRGTKRKDGKQEIVIGEDSHAANLVKLVTAAARHNVGELYWLGCDPKFL